MRKLFRVIDADRCSTENFVGRDQIKHLKLGLMKPAELEEIERTQDVGLDERCRINATAVDVSFGSEMEDQIQISELPSNMIRDWSPQIVEQDTKMRRDRRYAV